MSKVVARMEKMKAGNLQGIQRHNQRETDNHSNQDIEIEKSELNYDLVNPEPINYNERIHSIIDSQRISQRAIRKDAVLVDEWIITSDKDFFKFKYDTKAFFEDAIEYFGDRCGHQNIAYAIVHLDETTPHMHLGIVPMTEGKLSSKAMFDRQALKDIQEELPEYLKSKGHDIERGIRGSEQKHLTVEEFKENKKQIELMKNEMEFLEKEAQQYRNMARKSHSEKNVLEHDLKKLETQLEKTQIRLQSAESQLHTTKHIVSDNSTFYFDKEIKSLIQEKNGFGGPKFTITPENFEKLRVLITQLHRFERSNNNKVEKLEHEISRLNGVTKNMEINLYREISELKSVNRALKIENEQLEIENSELIEDFKNLVTNTTEFMEYELDVKPDKIDNFKGFLASTKSFNFDWFEVSDKTLESGKKIFEKLNMINPLPVAKKLIEVVQTVYKSMRL